MVQQASRAPGFRGSTPSPPQRRARTGDIAAGIIGIAILLALLGLAGFAAWFLMSTEEAAPPPGVTSSPVLGGAAEPCEAAAACCKRVVELGEQPSEALRACDELADAPIDHCKDRLRFYRATAENAGASCD